VRAIPTWFANLGLFHVDLAWNTLIDALQSLSLTLHYCFMDSNAMHGTIEEAFGDGNGAIAASPG